MITILYQVARKTDQKKTFTMKPHKKSKYTYTNIHDLIHPLHLQA